MRLSRRIGLAGLPAVVIAVLVPAAAFAVPTALPDPPYTARALAHHRMVLSGAARPTAPAAAVARLPQPDGPTWATARAIARHQVASFNAFEPIGPAVASARPAPARPDGPTWAAALVAGALAAAVAAGLGLMAGRRTVRVRAG